MSRNVAKSRQLLKELDAKYKKDTEFPKVIEQYRKKYATLKVKSLRKTITI